jgi:hypothetical protein
VIERFTGCAADLAKVVIGGMSCVLEPDFVYSVCMDEDRETIGQTEDRTLNTVCHALGLALYTAVPFANVWAPLILWLWKREGNPALDEHGKEVLNFQITMSIALIVAGVSMFLFVGFLLFPIVLIAHLVLTIMGTLEANKGRMYRYPMTLRLIK